MASRARSNNGPRREWNPGSKYKRRKRSSHYLPGWVGKSKDSLTRWTRLDRHKTKQDLKP